MKKLTNYLKRKTAYFFLGFYLWGLMPLFYHLENGKYFYNIEFATIHLLFSQTWSISILICFISLWMNSRVTRFKYNKALLITSVFLSIVSLFFYLYLLIFPYPVWQIALNIPIQILTIYYFLERLKENA